MTEEHLVSESGDSFKKKSLHPDVWVTLVENYERKYYPTDYPDPIESIKFVMEQRDLTVKNLVPMIGQTNRVYEILK